MIVVLHAYSRANSGDGLLVDETLELLAGLGFDADQVRVVALDPASFADLPHVLPALGESGGAGRAISGLRLLAGLPHPVRALIDEADALIAVGGGYLRTGRPSESLKTVLAHGGQLRAAARSGKPTLYLPQSVGPLRGPGGFLLRRWLRGVSMLAVRDDRTIAELPGTVSTERIADLAVLRAGASADDGLGREPRPDGPVLLAARALHRPRAYLPALRALAELSPDLEPVVQSSAGSGNDDRSFYRDLGWPEPDNTLRDRLDDASVVVSVRLHGALQAVLAGVPAIHLSYERKGFAAFTDLGVGDYVHSARDFDAATVRAQVDRLKEDPAAYWKRVAAAAPYLAGHRARLEEIAALLLLRAGAARA